MIDLRPVAFVVGIMLTALGVIMTIPAMVELAVGGRHWASFLGSAALTCFVGIALMLSAWGSRARLGLREAFLLTALSWVIVAIFGALPFRFAPLDLSLADCFFETMSGLTTTGATVIVGLDHAPAGLLVWRSLLQFIGGVGIIAVAVAVLPLLRIGGMQLFRLESTDKSEKVMPRVTQIAAGIIVTYVLMALVCALLYWAGGMSGFDAINHAMTTVATSGFSTSDASFGKFNSPFLELVGTVFMLAGGVTFTLYLRAWQGDYRTLLRDSQVRAMLGVFLACWVAVCLWLVLVLDRPFFQAVMDAAFNVASVLTTTGFATDDWNGWGAFPVVLFFLLTFVGGCSGSTTGGIKIFRFQVLFAIGRAQMRQALQPSGVFVPKYNGKPINEIVAQSVLAFVTLYVFTMAATTLALGLCGVDVVTALSGAAAAVSNVGPGLGPVIGPAGSYAPLPDSAKWVLAAAMLLGRLELITVLVLFTRRFWKD